MAAKVGLSVEVQGDDIVVSLPGTSYRDTPKQRLRGSARHASIRFVTGMLDPMMSRTTFIETAAKIEERILLLYGAATPPRSKAEMEALAALPHVRSVELTQGKLAIHEEFPDAVAEAVKSFLSETALDPGPLRAEPQNS